MSHIFNAKVGDGTFDERKRCEVGAVLNAIRWNLDRRYGEIKPKPDIGQISGEADDEPEVSWAPHDFLDMIAEECGKIFFNIQLDCWSRQLKVHVFVLVFLTCQTFVNSRLDG